MNNRWRIAILGALLQLCLGSVYAWSYFQKPLVDGYHWSNAQVAWTFSLAIGCLGIAAAVGGVYLPRFGPRKLAVTGSLLYGAGYCLGALALQLKSLSLLWLGYGVIGGVGLGLGYVTPVATVAKWFPDKKGLVTGMVVMGFGFGALLMSKVIAPVLESAFPHQLPLVFAGAGLVVGAFGLAAALGLRNPPESVSGGRCSVSASSPDLARAIEAATERRPPTTSTGRPESFRGASLTNARHGGDSGASPSRTDRSVPAARSLLASRRFLLMWLVFFCNIAAGIAIIGFQSPLLQDLWKKLDPSMSPAALAACGATLIATSSVFNGVGRFFWGGLSDRLGQLATFRLMLATQVVAFAALMLTTNPWLFGALVCYVLLCYGGGFGVMPSFVLNSFGSRLMPVLYGSILTAWSAGGVVGPQMVAWLKDHYGSRAAGIAFGLGAGLLALGLVVSLFLRRTEAATEEPVPARLSPDGPPLPEPARLPAR